MSDKSQSLTVYLLKKEITAPDQALADSAELKELSFKDDTEFEGAAYYKDSPADTPTWAKFVQTVVADNLQALLKNRHSSLVLFAKSSSRIFAVVFGYGRSLLDPCSYVRDFGLKVVLNAVDPDKLRCVDTNSLEEIPVATRQQASRVSALELFDIDREVEMMKALVGSPKQGLLVGTIKLENTISGSAALSLRAKVNAKSLAKLCRGLLSLYVRKDYQTSGFDWVDNLRPISDPARVRQLDELLLAALKTKDAPTIHLTPPELIEWERNPGFRYSTDRNKRRSPYGDLDIADFYGVSTDLAKMTRDELLKSRVTLKYADDPAHKRRYSLFDCIVFDTEIDGIRCVLAGGMWFEIDLKFAQKVEDFIGLIPESALVLPHANHKEHEGAYTERACLGSAELVVMDKKCIVPTDARTKIEVCDIFTQGRQFVHIKPYKSSSTLSHPFSQGTVSADLFQNDPGFRKRAKALVEKDSRKIARLISGAKTIETRDYEIIYAVIMANNGETPWQKKLPFFAKLNLRQATTLLHNRGYKVAVKLIHRN